MLCFPTRLTPEKLTAGLTHGLIRTTYESLQLSHFISCSTQLYLPQLEESHQTGTSLAFSAHIAQLHRGAPCIHRRCPTSQSPSDLLPSCGLTSHNVGMEFQAHPPPRAAELHWKLGALNCHIWGSLTKASSVTKAVICIKTEVLFMVSPALFFSVLVSLSFSSCEQLWTQLMTTICRNFPIIQILELTNLLYK